jgi:hypothetical protein
MIQLPKLPDPRTRAGVKTISRFLVARATSVTVGALITQNMDPETRLQALSLFVGSHAIGEIVADKTHEYVDKKVDMVADMLAEAKKQLQEAQLEAQS